MVLGSQFGWLLLGAASLPSTHGSHLPLCKLRIIVI